MFLFEDSLGLRGAVGATLTRGRNKEGGKTENDVKDILKMFNII